MTPEAQRIVIAEACGWKDIKQTCHEEVDIENRSIIHWSGLTGIPPEFIHYQNRIRIPDYLSDLNAMHEAEKTLMHDQYIHYMEYLSMCSDGYGHKLWDYVHCSASQRAEAFLRTIGKWKEANK
jgi:hypothetical protein